MTSRRPVWDGRGRDLLAALAEASPGWGRPAVELDADSSMLVVEHASGLSVLAIELAVDGQLVRHVQLSRGARVDRSWSWRADDPETWAAAWRLVASRCAALLTPAELLYERVPMRPLVSWRPPRNRGETERADCGALWSDGRGGERRRARDGRSG